MTTIKHTLQRQVFLPSEERLVQVVHVTKAGRKKKESFLCAAGKLVPRDKLWHCIHAVYHTLLARFIFFLFKGKANMRKLKFLLHKECQ